MRHTKINILMLGGARRVSMARLLKDSGQRLGLNVGIVSYELMADVPIACMGEVVIGKRWSDTDVVDDIIRVCRERDINIVLPFVDGAIEVAARCKDHLKDVFIPVSDSGTARSMFDKIEAARVFEVVGVPIPKTYSAVTASMPAIAKPRHGSASRGIKVFHNISDLMELEGISDYIVQEYIENREEYTVDCYVAQNGGILCTVPRLRIEVMGGEVTRTTTVRDEQLVSMSRKVLKTLAFRGPVTLQFLHDLSNDRYLLMEVNPRLGGGVICSISAGAPITDYMIAESLDIPVRTCDDWADHVTMARYLKEVIFYEK